MDSPARAAGAVVGILIGIILIVAILFGGRELGWWLKADNVNRQVRIDNTNIGTQQAWYDEVTEGMQDTVVLPDGPQKQAIVKKVCELIPRLTETYQTSNVLDYQQEYC